MIQNITGEDIELINMSIGGGTFTSDTCPTMRFESITRLFFHLREKGTVPFAASGNNGSRDGIGWPACDPSVEP